MENDKKSHSVPDLGPLGPNFGRHFFFPPQNLSPSATRYHGQLSSCTI